jgi:hypothetical protein
MALSAIFQRGYGIHEAVRLPVSVEVVPPAHMIDLQRHRRRHRHVRAAQAGQGQVPRRPPLLYGVAVLFVIYFLRGPLESLIS